jgi:hypothetical protein
MLDGMLIYRTILSCLQPAKSLTLLVRHRIFSLMLAALALCLGACALSEDLDSPPEDADNRVLGLKVEPIQFNTKRPTGKLNPHDETRVGTSVTIPLGFTPTETMPRNVYREQENTQIDGDEPLPFDGF